MHTFSHGNFLLVWWNPRLISSSRVENLQQIKGSLNPRLLGWLPPRISIPNINMARNGLLVYLMQESLAQCFQLVFFSSDREQAMQ